jgi:hypothetical protein
MHQHTNNNQPQVRRKRPHPARSARRAVGAAGVGGMLLMTGYMVANSAITTSAQSNTTLATSGANAGSKSAAPATPSAAAQSTTKTSG